MGITIRKAVKADLDGIAEIYEHIHMEEESGRACIGWIRGVYPERQTAEGICLWRNWMADWQEPLF